MTTILSAMILTRNIDVNQTRISDDVFNQLVKEQPELPVVLNFGDEPVGKTMEFKEENNHILVRVSVEDRPMVREVFLVPALTAFKTHMENGIEVIDEAKFTSLSFTLTPADPTLLPVHEVK